MRFKQEPKERVGNSSSLGIVTGPRHLDVGLASAPKPRLRVHMVHRRTQVDGMPLPHDLQAYSS